MKTSTLHRNLLMAMIRCAVLPWRSPAVYRAYAAAPSRSIRIQLLAGGLAVCVAMAILRHVVFGQGSVFGTLASLALIVIVPMLASYPAALAVAGISIGVDAVLLALQWMGIRVSSGANGSWELVAALIALVFAWRHVRQEREKAATA